MTTLDIAAFVVLFGIVTALTVSVLTTVISLQRDEEAEQ